MLRIFTCCQTVLFTLISFDGQAQYSDRYYPNVDLHVMPIALAHTNPSLRIGTEWMTGSRWSYGLSVGLGYNPITNMISVNDKRKDYQLTEIRPEVKYYWIQKEESGWYFAGEAIYGNSSYTISNSTYLHSSREMITFEKADFKKSKYGAIAKMGVKFLVGRKLTIDLFSGVGLARTQIEYSNVENPETQSYDPFPFAFEREDSYNGRHVMPQFVLGLKAGLRLWED